MGFLTFAGKALTDIPRWFQRRSYDASLLEFAGLSGRGDSSFEGRTVLLDGSWDNPQYWFSLCMFREAMGFSRCTEIGLLDGVNAGRVARTFKRLRVPRTVRYADYFSDRGDAERRAREYLDATRQPGDILDWRLPFDVPACLIFDGILKRQRRPTVDLGHGRFPGYVADTLQYCDGAERMLKELNVGVLVMSLVEHYTRWPLVWRAMQLGIPVFVLLVEAGTPRYFRLTDPAQIFECTPRPEPRHLDGVDAERGARLRAFGAEYLARRREGRTEDISTIYAYRRAQDRLDRDGICRHFGWDPAKPIVGVFASCWFDFPHSVGMSHFRDMLDWVEATVAVAKQAPQYNWLLRGHPEEAWYGGPRFNEVVRPEGFAHLGVSETSWNSGAVQSAMDAVVTYHSSAGVESAMLGKPVLIADRGWYHDMGFARWPRSRQEYLALLPEPWWQGMDLAATRGRAEQFAGWYYCCPDWQGDFIIGPSTQQERLYPSLMRLVRTQCGTIRREMAELRAWVEDGSEMHYHNFKMSRATDYQLSNIV